jgi:L-Ala-D/L-Glu epimerase
VQLHARTFVLEHLEPFVIARSSEESAEVVQVAIEHDGVVGYGEGAPQEEYGETPASAMAFLERAGGALGDDPLARQEVLARVAGLGDEMAARCAIDGALHDLLGKLCGLPLRRVLGLPRTPPPTSYTISIDTLEGTADRVRRARGYRALKVKLGGPDDLERVRIAAREAPDARIRVDANEGWEADTILEAMPDLQALGVELIEQPLPREAEDDYRRLHRLSPPIPIVVDESCHTLPDVARVAEYAQGVNLKLTKSGGIREALRMIAAARALGLIVMLGCMNESSLGIAQGAHISTLVDVVDLDGHLLNRNDAFAGLTLDEGAVVPGEAAGLGVSPLEPWP